MGVSRRLVILSGIGLAAAISTTMLWTGIIAVAAPVFDSATLAVRRIDGSRVQEDPIEAATFVPISRAVADSYPKLKEAMVGADNAYEIVSNAPGYISPMSSVYRVSISEAELGSLIASLPAGNAKQLVNDEKYVSTYNYVRWQYEDKYYIASIIEVGTQ
ncbi:MAG: hypothetical protein MN733_39220 [Nitrososphaera sp.]|nr:hypothetical protein [Nitrososphaera sp.]